MKCSKCGEDILNNSSFCSSCGNSVTFKTDTSGSKLQGTYRVYDNDKLHPNSKKMVITVLACLTFISFCIVLISKLTTISIVMFLFFTVILLKKVKALNKKKMIIFGEEYMTISWTSISKSVEEVISVSEIIKINLGMYSRGRGDKYTIEIYTNIKNIKFAITMAENMEIEEYFEWFSKLHRIKLDQNS